MHCSKMLSAVVLMLFVFVVGCNKHDKQNSTKKGTEMPALGKKSAADTSDIFKEFYSDDTAGQAKSKKASKNASAKGQTFSPTSSVTASSEEFSENGRYVVQVACVPTKVLAEKLAAHLKEKNFPAYTAAVQNPTPQLSGTFYRVRIGGFKGLAAAKNFGENSLTAAGYQYWVDKKSNDNVGMEGYGLGGATSAANPTSSYGSAGSSWSAIPETQATTASMPTPAPAASAPASEPSKVLPAAAEAPTPAKASPSATEAPTPAPEKAGSTVSQTPASAPVKASPASTAAPAASSSPAAGNAQKPEKVSSPAGGKSSTGSGEWGNDSSSSSGGW